jgi:HEAT repeat protein
MVPASLFSRNPDIPAMTRRRDIAGLIGVLGSGDQDRVTDAIHALGSIGPEATPPLVAALGRKSRDVRLGIISALVEIRDPRSVPALVAMLDDPGSEVRWQAAIALGEQADAAATAPLLVALRDPDKYVRYGSALALTKCGYRPAGDGEWAWYYAGIQDWEKLRGTGHTALPALSGLLRDKDSEVRVRSIRTLGEIGDLEAGPVLLSALGDEDRQVRWEAVLACRQCGVPPGEMPRALFIRPRATRSPVIAGLLNFMLPGLGYGYLGKWWGIMFFQIDITATIWLFQLVGDSMTYILLLPLYAALGFHAWYITKSLPEDPP